ncbi:MAG: PAS domain-containing protein [Candidatus Latescibacteria bacterium]|nr:PAS domain-containing protein [Candidatus Latescibacterota bacterium]
METAIQQLLHQFPSPLMMVDGALEVVACSRRAAALFDIRRPRGAGLEARLSEALAADRELGDELALATARLGGPEAEEMFSWRRDERRYEVRVWGAPFAEGAFLVLFADVTHQHISEEIQLDARHYLEHILANISLGVAVLNQDLKITFINRQQLGYFEKLGVRLGMTEAIGATLEALLPAGPGVQWQSLCLPVVRQEQDNAQLRQHYPTQAGELVLGASATALRDHRGEVVGAILVCENLTVQARLEQELLRMERLAVVGQMVVAMNHEINNPLGIIANSAQSLRLLHPEFDEKIAAKLHTIEAQVKRIAAVTERLRTMTELKAEEYIADGPKMIDVWQDQQAK